MSVCAAGPVDESTIRDVMLALKANGYLIKKYDLLARSKTARGRVMYKLYCEESRDLLLGISTGGIPSFYLQRSIRYSEEFSKSYPEFLHSPPILRGKINGHGYVVYEYLPSAEFTRDDYPLHSLHAFYARCAVEVTVNEEVVQKILESFLSAWPNDYWCAIRRLDEYVEYEALLRKEKKLTLAPEHGDYTTNNILRTQSGYFLIDFEFARDDQPVFFDAFDYLRSTNKGDAALKSIPNSVLHECKYRLIEQANKIVDEQNKNVTIFHASDHPALKSQWDYLYDKKGASYNLSREWCDIWCKNFLPNNGTVQIFTVWTEEKLAMLLPLYRQGSLLRPIGVQPDLYDGFSALCEDPSLCSHFVKYLKSNRLCFVGKYLSPADAFSSELFSNCYRLGLEVDSEVIDTRPSVVLSKFALSSKANADIKRLKNRIYKRFGAEPVIDISAAKDADAITALTEMHIKRWGGGPFKQNSLLPKFLFDVAQSTLTMLSILRVGNRTIAYHLGYKNSDGSVTSWIPTYDTDLSDCSPGKLLVHEVLASLKRDGHRKFDFGRGAEPYKYWFNTEDGVLINVAVFPNNSILGRLGQLARRGFRKMNLMLWTR